MSDEISDEKSKTKVVGRPFQKGQSGNPAGGNKPKLYRDIQGRKFEIEELFRNEAGRVFYELHKLICDPKTPATAKVSACKEFFDRALGKSTQMVRVSQPEEQYDTIDTSVLSNDVLAALAKARITNGAE